MRLHESAVAYVTLLRATLALHTECDDCSALAQIRSGLYSLVDRARSSMRDESRAQTDRT